MKKYYISYSELAEDEERAVWVEWVLRMRLGRETKMRKYDLEYGDNIKTFIDDALKWADVVVLILTDEYMRSENCKDEFSCMEEKRRLPVIFDRCKREGSFRSLYCLDLSGLEISNAGKELIQAIERTRAKRPDNEPLLPMSSNSIAMK